MKKIIYLFVAVLLFSISIPLNSLARDDNKNYKITIPYTKVNGSSGKEYRSTSSKENPWKVRLDWSELGQKTKIRFWLENLYEFNVSPSVVKIVGASSTYTEAYDSASRTYVFLTAENPEFNLKTFDIQGIWDEETW